MEKPSSLVNEKIKELRNCRNLFMGGEISAREFQDKFKEVRDEVKEKEGIKGILSLNKEIRKLEQEDYELKY